MASRQGGDGDVLSEINITPLVDVMLVLLVVMMVTASTIVTKSLRVNLPEGKTGTSTTRHLTVSIDAHGKWSIDEQPVDGVGLRRAVRERLTGDAEMQALISADGNARHARVVEVMDILREERVTRVAVGVSPPRP